MIDHVMQLFDDYTRSKMAIALGAGLAVLFYGVIFMVIGAGHDKTMDTLSAQLSREVVAITLPPPPKSNAKRESAPLTDQQDPADLQDNQLPKDSLIPAPLEGLAEPHAMGLLPKLSEAGDMPYNAYKKPIDLHAIKPPYIALALTDFGLSDRLSRHMVEHLSNEVTLLLSPYAPRAQDWQDQARLHGFETWLHIPFETKKYPLIDTGTQTVLNRSSLKLNIDRVIWALTRASGYAGIYSYRDETFAQAHKMSRALFDYMLSRGLGYLELSANEDFIVESVALQNNAPYAKADHYFDIHSAGRHLNALTKLAKDKQSAIGVIKASPAVIKALPKWIETLKNHGINLVPISAIDDYRWHIKNADSAHSQQDTQ